MHTGVCLSGVPVDNVIMSEALERIEKMIEEGGLHQVATANLDYLVHATRDAEYRRTLCLCDLVVADGMPIVWASRLLGIPIRERVAGADLVPQLVRLSALKGYGIFLLGATPEIIEAAELEMQRSSPGVRIVGRMSPPVQPLDQFDNEPILAAIEEAKPDILLVAFGSPKQEKWVSRNRHRLNVPVCIGIGGTLDFMAGAVRRAPVWMQRSGLEWLFRMYVDPKRLAPRYFKDAVWIGRYLLTQVVPHSVLFRRKPSFDVTSDSIGSVNIIRPCGSITGSAVPALEKTIESAIRVGRAIVLDLSETTHFGADGLWALTGLLRKANPVGCEVWLAGLSKSIEKQMKAAHFGGLFKSAPSAMAAVRLASRGRLQVSLELGDNWAICRMSGEIPESARQTLEEIFQSVRQNSGHLEFDVSGVTNADSGELIDLISPAVKQKYREAKRAVGAA